MRLLLASTALAALAIAAPLPAFAVTHGASATATILEPARLPATLLDPRARPFDGQPRVAQVNRVATPMLEVGVATRRTRPVVIEFE